MITRRSELSMANVIRARLSWWEEEIKAVTVVMETHSDEVKPASGSLTFSWAAVGSARIWPSAAMAQVTPQNRQLMDRPASIRAMQAAFRQQARS